jgi:hypothetical protein
MQCCHVVLWIVNGNIYKINSNVNITVQYSNVQYYLKIVLEVL